MGGSPINSKEAARAAARRSRRLNSSTPKSWAIPRKFWHDYMDAWLEEDRIMLAEEAAKRRLSRETTGPIELVEVLGGSDGGPSVGIDDTGCWILYTWTGDPVDEEIIVRHEDWDEFLRLCAEYGSKINGEKK